MNVSEKVNWDVLARSTDEFNGAQLKATAVEAGMIALREGATVIEHVNIVGRHASKLSVGCRRTWTSRRWRRGRINSVRVAVEVDSVRFGGLWNPTAGTRPAGGTARWKTSKGKRNAGTRRPPDS